MNRLSSINESSRFRAISLLLPILFFYLLADLLPTFVSIPMVPGMDFFSKLLLTLYLILGFKYLGNSLFRPIFYFLILSIFYFVINNYSKGFDHENPIIAFESLLLSTFLFYSIILKRSFYSEYENKLFFFILILILITSTTTIFGLIRFPMASRFMVGSDNKQLYLTYIRMNIGSYRLLYLYSLIGPTLLFFYFKQKKRFYYLVIGSISTLAVLYGQITGVILVMVLNSFMLLLAFYSKSVKSFFYKFLIITIAGVFFSSLLVLFIDSILPLLKDFSGLIVKLEEIKSIFTIGFDDALSTDKAENTEAYYERLKISWNGFLNSPITGGEDSGAHHYWLDYIAENGLLGLVGWLSFFTIYIKHLKSIKSLEWLLLNYINIICLVVFGLVKNIVISQMVINVFFLHPFVLLMLNNRLKNV